MIATARERIAKLREAEKMVGACGGAERQREQGASRTHLKEAAGTVARTLNLLLMVKKNQGWRSVCLGRESGAPVRNAGVGPFGLLFFACRRRRPTPIPSTG